MAHIGVSVDDDTKAEWEDYVEESNHGSMSELIRSAVRAEIRRDGSGRGMPREVEQAVTKMAEAQQTLETQMEGLADDFEEVSESTGPEYPEEIVELAHELAEELDEVPRDRYGDLESEVQDQFRAIAKRHLGDARQTGKVMEAFQYLEENLSYVKSAPQGPDDYYRVRGRY